jgi:DNA polymerase
MDGYLSIDVETRSVSNLKKVGVYKYVEDPTTDLWCLAYALGDERARIWVPGMPIPETISKAIDDGVPFRAWNAAFERILWDAILVHKHGWPELELERWYCTQAEAIAMGLPRALGYTAEVLKLPVQKDTDGRKLMMKMTRPRKLKPLTWWNEPGDLRRLCLYCLSDVDAERGVGKFVQRLSPLERRIYLNDQRINDRGVCIDLDLVDSAERIVARATEEANETIRQLTDGEVTAVSQVEKITRFLQYRGVQIEDLQKATVRNLLNEGEMPPVEQRILEVRADAGKTSVTKLRKMAEVACADAHARGLLLYHGAHTGRWTGVLIQPQNFPRPEIDDPEQYIPLILDGQYDALEMMHPPLVVISSLLRSMLVPSPGCRFLCADYAQIEARVLAWVAQQKDLLADFERGGKIYEKMGALIYDIALEEVTKDSEARQVGKNSVLGAGYQMGWEKFIELVFKQTGLTLPEETAKKAIRVYRETYAMIVLFWKDANRAAMRAVLNPGNTYEVGVRGSIRFTKRGKYLWIILPNGRPLAYALPAVERRKTKVGWKNQISYFGIDSYTKKWKKQWLYGGKITENIVQAIARDLMAGAMLRAGEADYPVVLTVHDEILADVPLDHGSSDEFCHLLAKRPKWAYDCPVAVEGWEGERYHK